MFVAVCCVINKRACPRSRIRAAPIEGVASALLVERVFDSMRT
jgi:hypothetical protein